MKIACLPEGAASPAGVDVRFDLYGSRVRHDRGRVGGLVPPRLHKLLMRPTERAWDFTSIALAVVAADETAPRSRSPDGWTREIDLTIAVAAPDFWKTQTERLTSAFQFLTGDIWSLTFVGGGIVPVPPRQARPRPEDLVCLLSGGMDSLVGAIDVAADDKRPLLVSQKAKGDSKVQEEFARRIAPGSRHLQLSHNARPPRASERSQRARSIVFLGFGVLAASCLAAHYEGDTVDLLVPENGFISQNVPLTPLRTGSLSTRTTHPYYFRQIQAVLEAAGLRARIHNPYEHKTKGEMLAECRNQPLLEELAALTTSCGRYSRTGFRHCGRCVPCQVRRAAYLAWQEPEQDDLHYDDTDKGYVYDALGTPDWRHAHFDDVRAVGMAAETIRRHGLDAWIGGAMNAEMLGNVTPYRAVAARGVAELKAFHDRQKVR